VPVFTPPVELYVPPVPAGDYREAGPPVRLFRFFQPGPRGVNVFKMSDGSYLRDDQQGVWPTTPTVPNDVMSSTWGIGSGNVLPMFTFTPIDNPVLFVYYGSHSYWVDDDEAARLVEAGFGDQVDLGHPTYGVGVYGVDMYGG
jgi:hypothetical protein